jgi:Protein kinase domain
VQARASNPDIAGDALSLLVEPEESVFPSWNRTYDSQNAGGGTAASHEQTLTGLRIGRYVVGEAVGRGATGDVYSALDTELERRVAMKFFKPGTPELRWKIGWLLREAKTASALNAPGIITVYEVIQSEAGLAIVMEFVDGTALGTLCTKPNPVDQVIRWALRLPTLYPSPIRTGLSIAT